MKLTKSCVKSWVKPWCGFVLVVDVVNFSFWCKSLFPAVGEWTCDMTCKLGFKCLLLLIHITYLSTEGLWEFHCTSFIFEFKIQQVLLEIVLGIISFTPQDYGQKAQPECVQRADRAWLSLIFIARIFASCLSICTLNFRDCGTEGRKNREHRNFSCKGYNLWVTGSSQTCQTGPVVFYLVLPHLGQIPAARMEQRYTKP